MQSSDGRGGLHELLDREGSSFPATVTAGRVAFAEDSMEEDGPYERTPAEALRFALDVCCGGSDSGGSMSAVVDETDGFVTPSLAAAFRSRVNAVAEACSAGPSAEKKDEPMDEADASRVDVDGRVAAAATGAVDALARLGPEVCGIDLASCSGTLQFMKKASSALDLCVESHSNFSSCRASVCVIKGKWQYETTLETAGIQQLGWATFVCPFTNEEGVGDAQDSYAYDGKRVRKWNVNCEQYGQPWACGDVIGSCIDLDKREIRFYRNGVDLGVAFRNVRSAVSGDKSRSSLLAYFPALSLSHGERCELNFGAKPFRYPVEGFEPLHQPPPISVINRARFLAGCLSRLSCVVETTTTTTARDVPSSTAATREQPASLKKKQQRPLKKDDAYVAAGLVMETLGPLIAQPYISESEILPHLVAQHKMEGGHAGIASFIDLLRASSEEHEFTACMENIFASLAHSCRTSFYNVSSFPHTASLSHLALARDLLQVESVLRCVISSEYFDIIVEGLMTRKQANSNDLSKLMPTVWWLGAQDPLCSEERMKSSCASISITIYNIEAKQREICEILFRSPGPETSSSTSKASSPPSNCFIGFAKRLLAKNRSAIRNVQPPGLSDNSVLVSVYFVILDMLGQSLVSGMKEHDSASFPASTFLRSENEYFDLGRLGGSLNHVRTEFELDAGIDDVDIEVGSSWPDYRECNDRNQHFLDNAAFVELLDMLVLFFHFGLASNFKLASQQLQSQVQAINQLDDTDRRIAQNDVYSEDQLRHLKEARAVFREDVIESVRACCWHRLGLFSALKQDYMVMIVSCLVKLLLRVSESRSKLFRYVPEAYIECIIDTFHALRRGDPPLAPSSSLLKGIMNDMITFVVKHFSDDRIVHPDSRDHLLQSISVLLNSKQYVRAFEQNEYARVHMARSLLQNFDSRFWIPISNIILRLCKGRGFGRDGKESSEGASPIFQELMCATCRTEPDILRAFLNKLFNTLNWTITEFSVALKDIMEIVRRRQFTDIQQQQRKWTIMYELSINLERIIEFLTLEVPEVFCLGDSINMVRLCEALVFVLSHTCGPSNLFDKAKRLHFQAFEKISKDALLEPVVGIIINLHVGYTKLKANRERGELVPWLPAEIQQGSIESFSRRLAETDSPEAIANVKKLANIPWADPGSSDPSLDRLSHLTHFFEELRMDAEAVKRSKEDTGIENDSEIPEAFLDPILMTLMKDPVLLPDSQQTIDRATIQRHLLSSNTDPFTRSELTLEMISPATKLKSEIEAWQECRRKRKASSEE